MDLPDVNILVHAFRRDSSDYERCREWLTDRLGGREQFALSRHVLSSFVRVVTHPRVFRRPSRIEEALAFCEHLLAARVIAEVQPGPSHWDIFASLCRRTRATGNDVPDAWRAALAIEHRCRWITLDRGFERFPGLEISAPAI